MTREQFHTMVNGFTPEAKERYWNDWRYMQALFEEIVEGLVEMERPQRDSLSPGLVRLIASVQKRASLGPETNTT